MPAILLIHAAVVLLILRTKMGWRAAVLATWLVGGVEVVALTETLSLFRALALAPLLAAWTGLTLLWAAAGFYLDTWRALRSLLRVTFTADTITRLIAAAVVVIVGASLVVALMTPPNNWDSLTYHMSRVAQWTSHQSVANYPTHILRQLHQNPFAEFLILQTYVLAGGDAYANTVQWAAWVVAIVAVRQLARDLGAGYRGQAMAALFAASLPMAVLQATNTQNDLVLGAMIVILAVAVLKLLSAEKLPWPWFLAAASAMGLAILTKGTGYLFAAPWLLLMTGAAIYRWRAKAIAPLAASAAIVIVLNAGHWSRNYSTYGSMLGVRTESGTFDNYPYVNDAHGPGVLVSNVLRNAGLHLTSPDFHTAAPVERGIRWILTRLSIDPDDPRTTWVGVPFGLRDDGGNNLELAGNTMHFVLAIACGVAALFRPRWTRATLFVAMTAAGFALFCIYLRWQPWHSRLHVPLFLLLAAPVGLTLQRLKPAVLLGVVAIVLLYVGGSRVINNELHPMLGPRPIWPLSRQEQYVTMQPPQIEPMRGFEAALQNAGIDSIGLVCNSNEPEYLLWMFGHLKCVKHVDVSNESAKLPPDPRSVPVVLEFKLDQGVFHLHSARPGRVR